MTHHNHVHYYLQHTTQMAVSIFGLAQNANVLPAYQSSTVCSLFTLVTVRVNLMSKQ